MNYITGNHIERRTFLKGMGATVALPLLEAMLPAGGGWKSAAAGSMASKSGSATVAPIPFRKVRRSMWFPVM